MSRLRSREWDHVYESGRTDEGDSTLIKEFYVPALERSTRYDRIAGYFSSSGLAVAMQGIEALTENDGRIRLIAGAELYESDRPVLEALTDELTQGLDDLSDEQLDARLEILAHLLDEDRLEIKIAVTDKNWNIFHPKLGLFHDGDETVSFEGSVNETLGGWEENYERFKLTTSWNEGQEPYVEADVATFDRLWTDDHPTIDVYDLPEAIEEDLIDWKAPDTTAELERAKRVAQGQVVPTPQDAANVVADAPLSPGGLALAEDGSTITPWPHQRVVSDTLVNTYPNGFLLCDEVGLGKTIEAGLTLSRLGLTNELDTGLLLVPAGLTVQWQEELWEKFNLTAYRYERGSQYQYTFVDPFGQEHDAPAPDELDSIETDDEHAWAESPIWRFVHQQTMATDDGTPLGSGPTIVIMSWHTARLSDRWGEVAPQDGGQTRTVEDVPASCRGRSSAGREGVWDAVLVDEAHNARDGTQFHQLLERLRDHTQTYYLLTATPMQLHPGELYDLMALLDLPDAWDDRDAFEQFFETRRVLSTNLDPAIRDDATPNSDWSPQQTLDGVHQDTLQQDRSVSERLFDRAASELDTLSDGERGGAQRRVMQACELAAAYGERYDRYVETVDRSLDAHEIDNFGGDERERLQGLLYPESVRDERLIIASYDDRLRTLSELTEDGWRVVVEVLREASPVDALIHRNTRDTLRKYEQAGLLDETVPDRNPEQHEIQRSEEIRAVYDRIDEYTRKFYKRAQQSTETETRAIGFVMTTYRQRLTSSVHAIAKSLTTRLDRLRERREVLEQVVAAQDTSSSVERSGATQRLLDTMSEQDLDWSETADELEADLRETDLSEVLPGATDEGLGLLDEEIAELESFVGALRAIDHDPKIDQLKDDIRDLEREGHNRIIIFTQYTDTMDFVRDELVSTHGEAVATYSGRGGSVYDAEKGGWRSVGKERVKREFASDGEIDVLVCTDSASEGLNLQTCGALINYDLPWNPMRVEQRIGRIDRIGQKYEEIKILNYSYADTVETEIYDRLDSRIDLFEDVVGKMQPVLSGVNSQIRSATMETDAESRATVVEEADTALAEQIDQEEDRNNVEIGESLETVEVPTKQEVIEEALLDAWKESRHPDIGSETGEMYAYRRPVTREGIEQLLVGDDTLRAVGINFVPANDLDLDLAEYETRETPPLGECVYRLNWERTTHTDYTDEETIAQAIAPAPHQVAVTFNPTVAEVFPSLQLLTPGHPMLPELFSVLRAQADSDERLERVTAGRPGTETPVVAIRAADDRQAYLDAEGIELTGMTDTDHWCTSFLETREDHS